MTSPYLVPGPVSIAIDSDEEHRRLALDRTRSWVVEAPAGSGKTGLIIQRYLTLLASPAVVSPEQVLAITFTIKAAAEMHERVLGQLTSANASEPPEREFDRLTRPLAEAVLERSRSLGWELITQPQRLNIRTIDSVCSQIARSLPVLSGSGGALSPVEDAAPLFALAASRTFLELGGNDRPLHEALHRVLLHQDGQLADAEALLAEMLRWREQWGELVPLGRRELDDAYLDNVVLPKLQHALEQAIVAILQHLVDIVPDHLLHLICAVANDLAHLPGYKGEPSPIALCLDRPSPPTAQLADLPHWQALYHLLIAPSKSQWRKSLNANVIRFVTEKNHADQLRSLIAQLDGQDDVLAAFNLLSSLPPAEYPAEQWPVAKALFRILSRALAELQLVFAERGECDFTELALAARTALSHEHGPEDLAAALGFELQHLLIDEMQDTSSGQYDLIGGLTAGWDGQSQTLFLVGDPKQSIYLFRQARVERFLRVLNEGRLGDLPLGRLALTANFRSQASLVEAFNEDFRAVFQPSSELHGTPEVPYQAAIPRRPWAASDDGRIWHLSLVPEKESGSAHTVLSQRTDDAAAIRQILEQWRRRPLPEGRTEPWKLAVLVRNRAQLKEIIASLQQPTPIPFRANDIEPLEDRREVKDLLALTRALLHPADRVAWLAVLRAPWCGLTLADLHKLTGCDDPHWSKRSIMSLIELHGHNLSTDGIARLERVWPALDAAVRQRARMPLAELVDRTWLSLGGDAYLSADETANVRRYLQRLDEIEHTYTGTLAADSVDNCLAKLYAAPSSHPDAVDLLTIHGAKGLEWDLVCVPALERTTRPNRGKLLTWLELDSTESQSAHILLAPIIGRGKASQQLNDWLNDLQRQRESAERKRLYYVACTRAREALHLFAAPQADKNGQPKIAGGSLLQVARLELIPFSAPDAPFAQKPDTSRQNILDQPTYPLSLAAGAATHSEESDPTETPRRRSLLYRTPTDFNPALPVSQKTLLPAVDRNSPPTPQATRIDAFLRPEGSFAARAFGNAVHAFLEQLALYFASRGVAPSLILPSWLPRIEAFLRSEGLAGTAIPAAARRVLNVLEDTLADSTGRWILATHPLAKTEYALTTNQTQAAATVRLDRTFLAGAEPLSSGDTHRWIIDYKTGAIDAEPTDSATLNRLLATERAKYQPQLNYYASRMPTQHPIHLALYYPELKRFIWWPYEDA